MSGKKQVKKKKNLDASLRNYRAFAKKKTNRTTPLDNRKQVVFLFLYCVSEVNSICIQVDSIL